MSGIRNRSNFLQNEPVWLEFDEVRAIHHAQIGKFGGPDGERDAGLIESALERPKTLFHYEGVDDALVLAIRLGVGLAQNHGFVDGNKRTGAMAMIEFLAINGYWLDLPNDTTLGALFEATVIGRMSEDELAEGLSSHIEPL